MLGPNAHLDDDIIVINEDIDMFANTEDYVMDCETPKLTRSRSINTPLHSIIKDKTFTSNWSPSEVSNPTTNPRESIAFFKTLPAAVELSQEELPDINEDDVVINEDIEPIVQNQSLSIDYSIDHSIDHSVNHSVNHSVDDSVDDSVDEFIHFDDNATSTDIMVLNTDFSEYPDASYNPFDEEVFMGSPTPRELEIAKRLNIQKTVMKSKTGV
jgi:hypothetical protein